MGSATPFLELLFWQHFEVLFVWISERLNFWTVAWCTIQVAEMVLSNGPVEGIDNGLRYMTDEVLVEHYILHENVYNQTVLEQIQHLILDFYKTTIWLHNFTLLY